MTMRVGDAPMPLATGLAIVGIGVMAGIATLFCVTYLRPVVLFFALGGLILILPTFVMRDPKAYWLFLLVVSIPFDISKRATAWLVQPVDLYREYGMPASGTLSLDFYLTDAVLLALLVPWLARLCLRRDTLYFPKVAMIFVLYLVWALIVSLIEAPSFYLSILEWCRQLLYFVTFLYIVNNVVTRSQVRAVVIALFIGLAIASASVVAFFAFDVGTETFAFSGLYRDQMQTNVAKKRLLYVEGQLSAIDDARTKRSAGMFVHPAHAGFYLDYILPILFAYLMAARRKRDLLYFGPLFGIGLVALYLTYSRATMVGLIFGLFVAMSLARWSELNSKRAFAWCAVVFAGAIALTAPVLIHYLAKRPETITKRFELNEIALTAYWKQPIMGAGLNNSTIVTEGAGSFAKTPQGRERVETVTHNYYLIMLIEVGLVGFLLYYAFFWRTVAIALRHMLAAETEIKLLLVGIVGSLASIAISNFAEPFGGHVVHAMLWLYAGLAIAICRQVDLTSRCRKARRALPEGRPKASASQPSVQ